MTARHLLVLPFLLVAGCAGMNEAVTVVPNTMDDLAAKTEGFRRGREPSEPNRTGETGRVEPPTPGL